MEAATHPCRAPKQGFVLFVHPATGTLDEWKERTFCFANGTNLEQNFFLHRREMARDAVTPGDTESLASSD